MQLVFRAANGDIIECGEEQGVTQGIVAGGGDDEDEEDTAGASHMHLFSFHKLWLSAKSLIVTHWPHACCALRM